MTAKLVVDNTMTEEKISDVLLITKKFKTSIEFSQFIERRSFDERSSIMDVIIDYCEKELIELESVNKLLSPSLKEKIKVEAMSLNMLKEKENQLPI